MTNKKITVQTLEKFSPANQQWTDEFLDFTTLRDPASIHFFYESGISLTTGNRKCGANYRGKRAIELQRYSSNANYTINLLHSMCGVDCFNMIPGASNTEEMLSFFLLKLLTINEMMELTFSLKVMWLSWTTVAFTFPIWLIFF